MAGHGVLDCYFAAGSTNNLGNEYVTLFNFLTGSQAQSLGIQRIAYNTGSAAGGTGIDYVGTANQTGKNAWSVWCWTSASNPFYLMLQTTFGAVAFGTSPGNPGVANAATDTGVIAAAFAIMGSGITGSSGPWNGTTNNNGGDTKGAIVWKTGSTGNIENDKLYVFPRSNSGGGTHQALRQNMIPISTLNSTANTRTHFMCDENNFCFVFDSASADGLYGVVYFGKYSARSGSTAIPYVMITHNDAYNAHTFAVQNYGTTTGGSYTTGEGGICVPKYPNGTLEPSAMSGTCIPYVSVMEEFFLLQQPNLLFYPTAMYDEVPFQLSWNETPYYAGYAGALDWIRQVHTAIANNDTNTDKTRAYFGSIAANRKVSVPWDGVTTPGVGLSVTGSIF